MLLQQPTPDTFSYLLLGYAVLLGMPLLYVLSFIVRQRNLEKDLQLIETMREEQR